MDLIIQNFMPGHPFYTDAFVLHTDKDGNKVKYQSNFGQCIRKDTGEFIDYTLQRRDTQIPFGTYKYIFYNSTANHCVVPLLLDVQGFEKIEHHIANWAFELKGCTAHGLAIDLKVPGLISSRTAFTNLMKLLDNKYGTITYEQLAS